MNNLCNAISKVMIARIIAINPAFPKEQLETMSLACLVDTIFLLIGSHGSLGTYNVTQAAIRHMVGDECYYKWPDTKSTVVNSTITLRPQ